MTFTCIKCNLPKPIAEKTSGRGDYRCKLCVSVMSKEWRQRNREAYLAYNKAWNEAHPEETRAAQDNWREEHRDQVNIQTNARYAANPEKFRARKTAWFAKHPEVVKQHRRDRRARLLGVAGVFTDEQFQELKRQYGYICLCCFRSEGLVKLEADHVVPVSLGGINDISNIQPLCKSCNCKKHVDTKDYRMHTLHGENICR